jgi:tetratricopeptide (TPR) repeat protein
MISVKLPGAFAEPHYQAFLHLQFHGSELEDDPAELERQRLTEISAAARANPRDCRTQHLAAGAFIRMFNLRQEASDTPLSLDQLRDAAVASEFSSVEALNEWLNAAVGPNRKLLKAAQHYARRAVLACPLEGRGYLYLARLDFLRDPQASLVVPLHRQALAVRPFDAMVDFEIGRSALLDGDFETAMEYWRKAFHRSPAYRKDIAAALAGNFSAEELLDRLQPDCDGLSAMVAAFTEAKLDDELPQLREKYAEASIAQARQLSGWRSEQAWQEAARMYQEDGRPERAIRVLQDALEQHSQSLEFHKAIGKLLFEQERFAGAAKHLQWAALRAPDDEALQRLAADAIKQKLRHERTAERDEAVH